MGIGHARYVNTAAATGGFTLIEVAVVIFIIALLLALVVPVMNTSEEQHLRREALRFRNALEQGTEQALYEEKDVVIQIDLQRNGYRLDVRGSGAATAREDREDSGRDLIPVTAQLQWGLARDALTAPYKRVRLTPWGPAEPIVLQFVGREHGGGYQVVYTLLQARPALTRLPEGAP